MTNEIRKPKHPGREANRGPGFGFHQLSFIRHWSFIVSLFILLLSFAALGQKPVDRPRPLDPVQGEREARALIAELLSAKPEQPATNAGRLKIRDRDGNQRELNVKFELSMAGSNILSVYQAVPQDSGSGGARLTVIHSDNQPNQYQLAELTGPEAANTGAKNLTGKQAMVPFAGSDFWLADLGLEFLHWPQQRLLRKELRHSQSCGVLESINPDSGPGGYARVVSWIDLEAPHGVVHADAFDAAKKRIKQFDPKSVKKIEGQYKLEAMEMLDEKSGSRSVITFDLTRD